MGRQESSPFQDVLVSLLSRRGFAFGKLPNGTVEDWLWYRLHLATWRQLYHGTSWRNRLHHRCSRRIEVHLLGEDNDQSEAFKDHLNKLREQAKSGVKKTAEKKSWISKRKVKFQVWSTFLLDIHHIFTTLFCFYSVKIMFSQVAQQREIGLSSAVSWLTLYFVILSY